jgi:hypothetical protein
LVDAGSVQATNPAMANATLAVAKIRVRDMVASF